MWPFNVLNKLRAENKQLLDTIDFLRSQNDNMRRLCQNYAEENKGLTDKLTAIELAKREEEYSKRSLVARSIKLSKTEPPATKPKIPASKRPRKTRKTKKSVDPI